jgi:uncharacterized protein
MNSKGEGGMDSQKRRDKILTLLEKTKGPLTGAELARICSVSRQVVVQDMAVLRARGEAIMATPQGYVLLEANPVTRPTRTFACTHCFEGIEKELALILDHGGVILNVVVEHQLYGELRAPLMIRSKHDLSHFMKRMEETGAKPLSDLTGGIHFHTVEADSEETLDRIGFALGSCGILCPSLDKEDTSPLQ